MLRSERKKNRLSELAVAIFLSRGLLGFENCKTYQLENLWKFYKISLQVPKNPQFSIFYRVKVWEDKK